MNNKVKKVLVLLLAMVMLLSIPVSAASVNGGKSYNKAKKVGRGTTVVTQKAGTASYVKFKAPKTKKYKFTISSLRCGGSFQNVYANAHFATGGEYNYVTFKQNGNTTTTLFLTTTRNYNSSRKTGTTNITSLPKRTASFRLAKGQTVVMRLYAAASGSPVRYNLKIS
ncbi:MAG: hypothetical protein Q4B01_03675 [Eubacteriales bacterium]|nr:hypothetical protein [Eubacteriales bacterium]